MTITVVIILFNLNDTESVIIKSLRETFIENSKSKIKFNFIIYCVKEC